MHIGRPPPLWANFKTFYFYFYFTSYTFKIKWSKSDEEKMGLGSFGRCLGAPLFRFTLCPILKYLPPPLLPRTLMTLNYHDSDEVKRVISTPASWNVENPQATFSSQTFHMNICILISNENWAASYFTELYSGNMPINFIMHSTAIAAAHS